MATLDVFFPASYPEARMWRKLLGLDPSYQFKKRTFSSLLSRLHREGLVEKTRKGSAAAWSISRRGTDFLRSQARSGAAMHTIKNDGIPRIVSFDIPERERKKRRWLRELLREYGYRPIQRSVWVGFAPLPRDFVEELDLMRLRDHIQVFSVHKAGTLFKEDS